MTTPDDDDDKAAATRKAKGSVHEAIGKLIGDDAATRHGAAEQRAGDAPGDRPDKSRRR